MTQQWELLEEHGRESEDICKIMIKALTNAINKIKSICNQFILLIDANKSFNSSEKGISSLVEHTRMTNPVTNKHGTRNEPNKYKRGSQRIDYILCTHELTSFIKLYGILLFDFIKILDHRDLYIDIDLALFFKDPLQQFINNKDRLLRTSNPKCVTKYKSHLMKHMQQHNLFHRG